MKRIIAAGFLAIAMTLLSPKPAVAAVQTLTVLDTVKLNTQFGTIWRYYETWQSDVTRVDGKLVHVDVFDARTKSPDGWKVKPAKRVMGSPLPPDAWRQADFDDSSWIRHPGPFPNFYRSLALICMRGKFEVADPNAVTDLSLSVKFQGGVVAYLNGHEVGRSGLPAGKIDPTTLADPYPHDAYVTAENKPIVQDTEYPGRIFGACEPLRVTWAWKNQDTVDRFKLRGRSLDAKIPSSALKKGLNVLAIEIHRAESDPILFTSMDLSGGNNGSIALCWNRAACEQITLTATAADAAIKPNTMRPPGLQVWQEGVLAKIGPLRYGDPNEPLRPIKLIALPNGVYAGQVVVGSRNSIRNLTASVSDLSQDGSLIPSSSISLGFPSLPDDALEATAPALIEPPRQLGREVVSQMGKTFADAIGVVQPVWVIVQLDRNAHPGKYTGSLTINVDAEKPVAVPIELAVVAGWSLPDARDFTEFIGVHESADSVAMQYNEPLWSDQHWKHLDKIYELLGQIGTKDIYLTAVAKTHLANEQSMVCWIKQPDGSYQHDFSILEKYLDTAMKHLGKPPVICLYLHDYGFRLESAKLPPIEPVVTEFDPATGQLSDLKPPQWGTPEARAFWRPVIDGVRAILAKRGVEKSLMFGIGSNNWVLPACSQDLKTLYPDIRWVNRTHYYSPYVSEGPAKQPVGLSAVVGGVISVFYDPDVEPHYGWKSPDLVIDFPRFGNVPGAVFNTYLSTYRIFGEAALISGGARWRSVQLVRGVGHIGADFWPVLKDKEGHPRTMGDRYVFWHSLSISEVIPSILGAGKDGPVTTCRHQMMRQSIQEAEVRIYVQNALLDKSSLAKLPPALAKRCKELCDERTDEIRYYSQFCEPLVLDDYAKVFDECRWQQMSQNLYEAAGQVHKALGDK